MLHAALGIFAVTGGDIVPALLASATTDAFRNPSPAAGAKLFRALAQVTARAEKPAFGQCEFICEYVDEVLWCGLHSGCQEPLVDGDCDTGNDKSTSDSVYLFSGEYYLEVEDLRIPGRGFDFVLTRTYRSKTGRLHFPLGNSVNRMGHKWDWSYNIYLREAEPYLIFCNGRDRIDWFRPQPDGTWTHPGYFRVIEQEPNGSYTMRHADGTVWRFIQDPFSDEIVITEMIDRDGGTMQFNYVTNGIQRIWLDHIIDTLGRVGVGRRERALLMQTPGMAEFMRWRAALRALRN